MSHTYKTPAGQLWVIDNGLVYGALPEVLAWMSTRTGDDPTATLGTAIGVLRPGTAPPAVTETTLPELLVAGVFFFDHQSGEVSDLRVSVAADDIVAAHPGLIRHVLDYPFGQLGVRRLTAEIDLCNERSVRQAQQLGFKLEGRKRRMGRDSGDVGVFGLLPDECPFWAPPGEPLRRPA